MKLEIDTDTKIITVVECEPDEMFVFYDIGRILEEISQGLYQVGREELNNFINKREKE